MATPDQLKGAIETYIERFSAGDSGASAGVAAGATAVSAVAVSPPPGGVNGSLLKSDTDGFLQRFQGAYFLGRHQREGASS